MAHKLLIVSDDRPLSTTLKEALSSKGHLVMTASRMSTGLPGYDVDRFDLVFLDVSAPDNGKDIMQALQDKRSDIPIIGLIPMDTTGAGLDDLFEMGMVDTLTAPNDFSFRLHPLIRRTLAAKPTAANRQDETAASDRLVSQSHEIMQIMAKSPTLSDSAPHVLDALMASFGWSGGHLWVAEQQDETFRCLASASASNVHLAAAVLSKPGQTADQSCTLTNSVRTAKRYHIDRASNKAGTSVDRIGFPILSNDVVLGLFEFVHPQIDEPTAAQIRVMAEIGRLAAMYIERERLEDQMRESQKMKAIGRMAGSIAHDFNNILMTITGRASLLARKFVPMSEEYDHVDQIKKAGDRAAALIDQLLAFNRSQTMRLERMPFDEIVGKLAPMIRQSLNEKVTLDLDLDTGEEQVLMDRTQIDQVVMNLSVNARDAMPDGGTVTLRTGLVELSAHEARLHGLVEGAFIRLDVKDTGTGMEEQVRAHIFEPFFTTKKDKGNGLGLATVYNLVTQNGGTIQVSSRIGHGSTFTVYLPVLRINAQSGSRTRVPEKKASGHASSASKDHPAVKPPARPARPTAAAPVRPMPRPAAAPIKSVPTPPASPAAAPAGDAPSILIIDDEEDVRSLICSMLEKDGYRLLTASGGHQALGIMRAEGKPVDLIISDLLMPDMNGVETVLRIQEMYPDTPVLYISGMADRSLFKQASVDDGPTILKKPFGPPVLKHHVREALSGVSV